MIIDDEDGTNTTQPELPKSKENSQPPLETKVKYSYDLHEAHTKSGATDTEKVPFLMVQWTSTTHIPYTFPVAPKRGKAKKAKRPRARHCFAFLKNGSCAKGSICSFPHLSATQVNVISQQMRTGKKRASKSRRKSKRLQDSK